VKPYNAAVADPTLKKRAAKLPASVIFATADDMGCSPTLNGVSTHYAFPSMPHIK
jgi:hypothetical protein